MFSVFSNKSEQAAAQISEVKTTRKAVEPKYKIVQEPVQGHPEFLVAEVRLSCLLIINLVIGYLIS